MDPWPGALPAEDPAPSPSASEVITTVEAGEGEYGPAAGASEEPSEPSGEPSEPAGQSGVATAGPGEQTEEPATTLGEASEEPGTEPGEPTDAPGADSEEGARSLAPQEDVVGADSADGPIEPAPAAADAITPLAAGDATIRVQKAGVRKGNSSSQGASGLQGAVFEAYADGTSQTQQYDPTKLEATCTTDAAGNCDLLVDSAKGPRYVVVEKSAPAGWRKIDQIALGAYDASGTPRNYWWNVGVRAGQTTLVPRTEIRNVSGQNSWPDRPNSPSTPAYQWADALDNVPLPAAKCGLSIAMLFDQSGSIGSNLPLVKDAAKQFVDELTGTPTSIALFTFSTDSPQNTGGSQNRPALVSIADAAGANQVKGYINGFSAANGGTNWDAGLRRVANASQQYDVLIVLTDGNPTAWEGEKSSTGDVDDYDVENAIHSANWVKSKGTRIVAVGFSGQSGGLNALNLTTISGTVQDDDYYLTTFGDLDDVLSEIALNGCGGTINVQKRIAPTWTGIAGVPLEPNWGFEREAAQDYVTPSSGVTGPAGEPVTFKVTFEQGQLARPVTITEDPGSYTLIPDGAKNARCLVNNSPINPSRILNVANGFTVTGVTDKEIISCLVVNSPAQLRAKKYNDLNANGQQDAGEPGLQGWTLFLDKNSNSVLDAGDQSLITDPNGLAIFDRLEAPADYRICEVQKSGWFNTDPGGGTLCKPARTAIGTSVGPDVNGLGTGTLLFGNIERGAFTITKKVVDGAGFVPANTTYTVEVRCTLGGSPVTGYNPRAFTLTGGQTVTVGPLQVGTTCAIAEVPAPSGVDVTVQPTSVTIGQGGDVNVMVTNTYPVGYGEVVKVVDGQLAGELAPPGTEFEVEVSCTFPTGFPVQGAIPGYDPKALAIESGATVGQPGPAVKIGPLPVGTTCTATETDDNGADPSSVSPGSVTIAEGGPTQQTRFTASNTYNPAAVKVLKKVEPAGIVPDDTEFTARVDCWFPTNQTPGQGPPDRSETVTFSVDQPGVVSNLPLNSLCQVTETDTHGASAVVDPAGLFPVDADPFEVTITNTFPVGQLTVEKVVTDPSGLVAAGTEYTINVACTFDGNDLPPRDVVLTYATDLSETLTGIPFGTTCTLTEQDLNGAASVTFEPGGGTSATVTIGPDPNDDVTVTATNDYPAGTFPIRKSVIGPGAGFVPAGTEFEVTVTCTLPAGFPGTDPAPYVVTIEDGQTVIVPTAPDKPLPVGTTCSAEETGTAGAGSSVVLPDQVEIENEGAQNVEVLVTNTFPAGTFTVRKLVAGPGRTWVPPLTDFEVEVSCTYPDGFPAQGAISGYDPKQITIDSGSRKGVPGVPVTVGPLPVGSQCSLVETPNGTDDITYDPSDTVTVLDATADPPQDPVNVLITNTYPVGTGEIVKVVDGDLAEELAPAGTVFLVEVECTFPADFPGTDLDPEPIPGFDPLELAVESAGPGGTPIPVSFGPVPVGSSCIVTETETGGADPVVVDPPGSLPNQSDPVIITEDAQEPVTVTFTNTFNPAALQIIKVLDGPGASLIPTDTVFKARVTCTIETSPGNPLTTFDDEVEFSVDNPGEVTNQPVGASCTVTETETNGATDVDVSPNPVVLTDPDVVAEVTVTNTMPAGELTIQKVIGGEAAGVVPDGVEFTVGVNCSFNGSPLPGYPVELTLTTPDQLSRTITPLPVGAQCYVNESDSGGATSVEFAPPAGPSDPAGQSGTVTITDDSQEPVTVTVTNIFDPAVLRIFKEVLPEDVLLPPDLKFTAQVDCTFEGESIYSGEVKFGVGSPGIVSGLIVGAECTVTEADSQGATWEPETETVILEGDGSPVTVDVTITNTFQTGSLTVEKVVDDGGTGLVPDGTEYQIDVACTFAGLDVPGYPTQVTVTPGSGPVALPGKLAVGTVCDLSEADLNGAGSATFSPSSEVTITEENSDVAVVVTNTYPVGTFQVAKSVVDPGGFVPAGTVFTIEVSCSYPEGFPVTGAIPGFAPKILTLTGGNASMIGPLPVGSVCAIKETGQAGATSTSIVPDKVIVGQGEDNVRVVVTNTYALGDLVINKVITGSGASSANGPFQFSVTCTFLGSALKPQPATVVITPPALSATVSGLPVGAECTVAELPPYGGADGPGVIAPSKVVVGSDQSVKVVATNTFTKPPVPPAPSPETCNPNVPGAQLPGSITIPVNPEFGYAINGVPYAAGTYPFPAGSYEATATRIPARPVAAAGAALQQLATQDVYTWTVVVPGSPVCPVLDKSANPPSGETVLTGDIVTYTITVRNGGDTPVVNETLVDTLPDGADLIDSSVSPANGVYDSKANTLTWKFSLPAAAGGTPSSATFSYQVEVTSDDGSLVNSVEWVERDLTGQTEHPVEPGTVGGTTDKTPPDQPATGGLTDTGAGEAVSIASAGLLAMLLGGFMVVLGRCRRREE